MQPHTPRPPLRRDFGDGAAQPFMSERISHSHSLEQKRLKGSPVRCFPLLISKSSLKEHFPPGGGSSRLGDDGESRCRGSALVPGCSPASQRAPSSAPAPTHPTASSLSLGQAQLGSRGGAGKQKREKLDREEAWWPEFQRAHLCPQPWHSPPDAGALWSQPVCHALRSRTSHPRARQAPVQCKVLGETPSAPSLAHAHCTRALRG